MLKAEDFASCAARAGQLANILTQEGTVSSALRSVELRAIAMHLEAAAELLARSPCLQKLAPDEPFFVLRGQDVFTPALIQAWVALADAKSEQLRLNGASNWCPQEKIVSALTLAKETARWSPRKYPD